MPTEVHGHGDAQLPPGFGQLIGRERIRGIHFNEYCAATFVVGAPELGQALTARSADDEAHPQALFKRPHVLANHRPG